MTHRLAFCAVCLALLLCGACASGGDRYVVAPGNEGNFSVKHETNPMDTMPKPARETQTGPTQREIELQKRIDQLEAQQRTTDAELERLKAEKAKGQ